MVKAFAGTVHLFRLHGMVRRVIDPQTIPEEIRDSLCRRHNYWLDSMIGPNHDVAHFDLVRQSWRDMRHAERILSFHDQPITYNEGTGSVEWT